MTESLRQLLLSGLALCLTTVVGTVIGLLIRRIPVRWNDVILGAAAGFMLGAAVLGLLLPAATSGISYAAWMTVAGALIGALCITLLDSLTPHLHKLAGMDADGHEGKPGSSRVLLFVAAIVLHKFPEGIAAGVSVGSAGPATLTWTVVGSLCAQNIPEAVVIVAPLLAVGVTMRRTVWISLAVGVISFLGTLLGGAAMVLFSRAIPLLLSFAGGMMLYVICDEMIPEMQSHGGQRVATFAFLLGFLAVLLFSQM